MNFYTMQVPIMGSIYNNNIAPTAGIMLYIIIIIIL